MAQSDTGGRTGFYDLSENALDVWRHTNPYSDNEPTDEALEAVRDVIRAHYAFVAKRLGEGWKVRLDGCGSFALKLRKGREVTNFATGDRYEIPDFFEVEFNASPALEALVQEGLKPPAPTVK